jgi:transcriptional regulator with XRE-family HTH domain
MKKEGRIKSQREFAEFLGIDSVKLNQYLNSRRKKPDTETVKAIASALGPEIYDVLGLARPDPQLQELTGIWHKLDQETKSKLLEIAHSTSK